MVMTEYVLGLKSVITIINLVEMKIIEKVSYCILALSISSD